MFRKPIVARLAAYAIAAGLVQASAAAQTWPTRPIMLVVPSAAGNASDAVAGILANKMSAALGQRVLVENRVGASGNLGTAAVANAAPDGYTLGLPAAGPLAINKTLFSNLPYDPETDFESRGGRAELATILEFLRPAATN